jgi:Fur family zinc uptake transcriptional regulator
VNQCTHQGEVSCTRPTSEQVRDLLRQAERLCAERKQRLTEIRRRVLELVCGYKRPVGAYALLDDLREEGRSAAPPTVYRALDFLQQQGLVHRLATNNTYIACAHPDRSHEGVFLVCNSCGCTQEIHSQAIIEMLQSNAGEFNFQVQHAAVEITGLCLRCGAKA